MNLWLKTIETRDRSLNYWDRTPFIKFLSAYISAYFITTYSSMPTLLWSLALSFFLLALSIRLISNKSKNPKLNYYSQWTFHTSLAWAIIVLFSLRLLLVGNISLLNESSFIKVFFDSVRENIILRLNEDETLLHSTKLLAKGMGLGLMEVSEDSSVLRQQFADSGTAHLLAVSGFHLALIIACCNFLLQPIKNYVDNLFAPQRAYKKSEGRLNIPQITRAIQFVILIIVAWLFVLLTGSASPTIRTGVMLTIFLLIRLFNLPTPTTNILFLSLFLQLLFTPCLLTSPSLWLSHLAVLSIHLFYKPIFLFLIKVQSKPKALFLWQTIAVTLSVQVLILPLCLYFFGHYSFAFIFTSLPITLLTSLFIPLVFLCFILQALQINFVALDHTLNLLAEVTLHLSKLFAKLDFLHLDFDLSLLGLLTYYLAVAILLAFRSEKSSPAKV